MTVKEHWELYRMCRMLTGHLEAKDYLSPEWQVRLDAAIETGMPTRIEEWWTGTEELDAASMRVWILAQSVQALVELFPCLKGGCQGLAPLPPLLMGVAPLDELWVQIRLLHQDIHAISLARVWEMVCFLVFGDMTAVSGMGVASIDLTHYWAWARVWEQRMQNNTA